MTDRHFDTGYWKFLKKIQEAGGVPCEDHGGDLFTRKTSLTSTSGNLLRPRRKRLCNTCPIKNDCLEYAIESNQRYGIWAGDVTLASADT